MSSIKESGKKIKLVAAAKKQKRNPRWTDIKKYGLKRAISRRIRTVTKNWRNGRNKI